MFTNRPAANNKDQITEKIHQDVHPSSFGSMVGDIYHIRDQIQNKLLVETGGEIPDAEDPGLKDLITNFFNQVLVEENLLYTQSTRDNLLGWIIGDILEYGPINSLLNDRSITEVMVNGPDNVYVERAGRIEQTDVVFENADHLMRIIDRIVSPIGRRVDESSPMVDARLPNGYRVNVTIPPLSLDGPLVTIRKFAQTPFTPHDLIANSTVSSNIMTFLEACVKAKVNIVISGGTGAGKTTYLNVMSSFIPGDERIITIEDTAELQLNQEHVVRVEKRPPNVEGKGEVTIRRLVINALRMRPDRIIVGEARGGEALDMLQAMNTGHEGSMTTIHSNGPRDALRRIETMVLMAGTELTLRAIREQVSSAIELIVHMKRMRDGTRKVVNVAEVQGLEGETIIMQDLFEFKQVGYRDGRVHGEHVSTGLRPYFSEKFEVYGVDLPENLFMR
jgi:pilus assembly protein CpaF